MSNGPVTMTFSKLELARLAASLLKAVMDGAPPFLKVATAAILTHGTPAEIKARCEHLIEIFGQVGSVTDEETSKADIEALRLYLRIMQIAGVAEEFTPESQDQTVTE